MDTETLIKTFGYPAIALGVAFEGETVLLVAGYLAHRGYFDIATVMMVAMISTTLADQWWFHVGRTGGKSMLDRRPRWADRVDPIRRMIDRHQVLVIMGFRFIYGLRTITPVVLGMTGVPLRRFIPLNILSATIWAVAVGVAGYLFGQLLENFWSDLRRHEWWIAAGILVMGGVIWAIVFFRHRPQADTPDANTPDGK
ncbi:MAG: DedA family protein [Phycisphaera sp.]|nr:DedA family protein [Phycisphaera sp.]